MASIQYCRNIIRQTSDLVLHHPILFAGQGVRYRKLEVILTATIDKLGKAGETVKVASGHFRNHLMPKLLAVPNIDNFAHLINEQRKIYQPKEVEEVKVVHNTEEDITKEISDSSKTFIKVDNELREPVTPNLLPFWVARQLSVHIEPENLHLPTPLPSLGAEVHSIARRKGSVDT